MNTPPPVHVLIRHDDALVAAGLSAVLSASPDFVVRVELSPYTDRHVCAAGPATPAVDVLVADHGSAIDWVTAAGTRADRAVAPALVFAPIGREWEVRHAMRLGVRGYLLQGCPVDELMLGVARVAGGFGFLGRSVAQCMADGMLHAALTQREREVLALLAEGLCNKAIARDLGIALGTVKTHVKSLLDKLGATTRTHAVVLATRRGLLAGTPRAQGRDCDAHADLNDARARAWPLGIAA